MRLSECVQYINTALNYPALTYIDIALFFDMAIAELNTTLHINMPTVKNMIQEFRQKLSRPELNKIILTSDPSLTDFQISVTESPESEVQCYYNPNTKKFYIYNPYTHDYSEHNVIKALYITSEKMYLYQSISYGNTAAWAEIPSDPTYECDLEDYLPNDWVLLWLIPYVCYKYTVRDGGTAQTFAEELTQGHQQLQETYDVPDKVLLYKYADKAAYTAIVENNLPNLNIFVKTRAIFEDMKHPRGVNAIYNGFYDRGGF